MFKKKTIGVLTSGGDCSGLNTAIRAVSCSALSKGWDVYGIEDATDGLFARPMRYKKFSFADFDFPYARLSGTMLGTNNSGNPHQQMTADGSMEKVSDEELEHRFAEAVQSLHLDALVVIGGDGSMSIVGRYCKKAGIAMVGIPKTIDNDVPATENAIGFSTAMNVVMDSLDKLDTTANSHQRIMVVEVMGRTAGHLALAGAIAGMADICLIPEIPYSYENVIKKLREIRASGSNHTLMVVAEGIKLPDGKHSFACNGHTFSGVANYFADRLAKEPDGFNVRANILGHIQRGGVPTAQDRILASGFAAHAIELLERGKTNRMVVIQNDRITDVDLKTALRIGHTPVDPKGQMVRIARGLGMYVGD